MKHWTTFCFLIIWNLSFAQSDYDLYLFSYFKGNGDDGLHLAYSEDGYTWKALRQDSSFLKPAIGKERLMRDPCIIKAPGPNGKFHMVWTTGWNEKGIGYASSDDLIRWSEQQYLPVMEHEPNARNCWAPEIFYDSRSQQFMIFWATTITGKFTETESEKENKYNHRIYYTLTKDFKTFSKAALLYDNGFNVIDATIVMDIAAKKYLMFLKDETIEPPQKNIRIAASAKLTDHYSPAGKPITGNYWAEGPTVTINVRSQGPKWFLYFDRYVDHKMGALASNDLQTWTDISEEVSFPEGMRHGSVFQVHSSFLHTALQSYLPK